MGGWGGVGGFDPAGRVKATLSSAEGEEKGGTVWCGHEQEFYCL